MKLSETRIRTISKKIARDIGARGAAQHPSGPDAFVTLIEKILLIDQMLESKIDEEARGLLARQKNLPPPGTSEYEAQFQQVKRNVAMRRRFPL